MPVVSLDPYHHKLAPTTGAGAAVPALAPIRQRPASPLPRPVTQLSVEEAAFKHDKRVSHYWLGRRLGEGAFAKVKEGMHRPTGEKVALKIIDKKKARADKYVSLNMRREAKLMTMICHPNVLRLLEEVETENSYYLVTEMAEGGDLMEHIYKQKCLPEDEVRRYVSQIVSAVDHIHKAGIIHRDLKIENLLLDADHNIKIIDFGLSNTIRPLSPSRPAENHCKTQCGSPAYAAPELLGREPYGIEVDIWSIGVNLFAMLTGTLPFTVDPFNITELHAKMLSRRMNPIPDNVQVTAECQDLLRRLLNPNRARRIKMPEIFVHPWFDQDPANPFEPMPFPNTPQAESIDDRILSHMTNRLSFSASAVVSAVVGNKACGASSTYYLLSKRLARYVKQHPESLRKRRGLVRQQRRRSTLALEGIEGINEDELLETVPLPSSGINGWPRDEKSFETQSAQVQRLPPWSSASGESLSPTSGDASSVTSPQGQTPHGPFSPLSLSEEDDHAQPVRRAGSFTSKGPRESRTMRKVTSTPAKVGSQTPVKNRIFSVNSSLASPGSPCTPEGDSQQQAPTPTALKKGVEQAFPQSRSREKSSSTWLPPTIEPSGGRNMTTASGRRSSMGKLQEITAEPTSNRRVLPSSFGKAMNDVRTNQAGSRGNRPESRQDDFQMSPPPRPIQTNNFFQDAPPNMPAPFRSQTKNSRRDSFVEELGAAQPQSKLPALNPRGSISAGKKPAGKARSSGTSTSRPHTTGASGAASLRPASQHGGDGVKVYDIDSLGGIPKQQVIRHIRTRLTSFRDIENISMNGLSIRCLWYEVNLDISVLDDASICSVRFERVGNGGNRLRFNEICDQIAREI